MGTFEQPDLKHPIVRRLLREAPQASLPNLKTEPAPGRYPSAYAALQGKGLSLRRVVLEPVPVLASSRHASNHQSVPFR